MKSRNTRRGFTLIELLVVVLIIGILAAVALPQYQRAVEKARAAEAVSILNILQKDVDLYLLEHGFPQEGMVDLLGQDPEATATDHVNIELAGTLKCDWEDNGLAGRCTSAYFVFQAMCRPTFCRVMAIRTTPYLDYDVTGPGNDVIDQYAISIDKDATMGAWTKWYYVFNGPQDDGFFKSIGW